jgi:hypothetical protein
MLEG